MLFEVEVEVEDADVLASLGAVRVDPLKCVPQIAAERLTDDG